MAIITVMNNSTQEERTYVSAQLFCMFAPPPFRILYTRTPCPCNGDTSVVIHDNENLALFFNQDKFKMEDKCNCGIDKIMITGNKLIHEASMEIPLPQRKKESPLCEFYHYFRLSTLAAYYSFCKELPQKLPKDCPSVWEYTSIVQHACRIAMADNLLYSWAQREETFYSFYKEVSFYFESKTERRIYDNTFIFGYCYSSAFGFICPIFQGEGHVTFIPYLFNKMSKDLLYILNPPGLSKKINKPLSVEWEPPTPPRDYTKKEIEKGITCPVCGNYVSKIEAYRKSCPLCSFSFSVSCRKEK